MSKNPHKIIPELRLNWALAEDMLRRFIQSQTGKAGFSRVVVGLSGGVDSALSAAMAVKALGRENVLGLKMPYRTSDPRSSADADKVASLLGVALETVEITPMAEPFFASKPDMDHIRRGNVMARLRMMVLFDAAMQRQALVLGTGNKTEILLGYTTWYGDNACSFNPIGDLYKTQVWEFAAQLDLPEEVIAKVPSADLWSGQTDEGELGLAYETADEILFRLVDKRMPPEEVAAAGYDEKTVNLIVGRMQKYHFKRLMPVIPKLSPRTVGLDFLYAHDWGA